MSPQQNLWIPHYMINSSIAQALMEIEAAKAVVEHILLPPAVEVQIRNRARIRSTHYSTRIEGNKLTLNEAQDVIENKARFQGRERDAMEVRNYWDALLKVENWAARKAEFNEDLIKRLHAIVERGGRAKLSPYRKGQNVIKDSVTGNIVYMPPEQADVPKLMAEMVRWVRKAEKERLPVPIIASLTHYQFVTIHPYFDGNGRTARLLATFILQRNGYGLNGFFSLEERHARDLAGYYSTLAVHGHYNYYMGRAEADLTVWIEYFVKLLAQVFGEARDETLRYAGKNVYQEPPELRRLDARERMVLRLFDKKDRITAQDVALVLGLSTRMVRLLLNKWTDDGWIIIVDASNRGRAYGLSENYRQFIGNISVQRNDQTKQ